MKIDDCAGDKSGAWRIRPSNLLFHGGQTEELNITTIKNKQYE